MPKPCLYVLKWSITVVLIDADFDSLPYSLWYTLFCGYFVVIFVGVYTRYFVCIVYYTYRFCSVFDDWDNFKNIFLHWPLVKNPLKDIVKHLFLQVFNMSTPLIVLLHLAVRNLVSTFDKFFWSREQISKYSLKIEENTHIFTFYSLFRTKTRSFTAYRQKSG